MKHKIFFFSYYYPPIQSIATRRNLNISRALKNHFAKVFVFTTQNSQFLPKNDENTEGIIIKSIFTFDYRTLAHWLSGKKEKKNTHFSEQTKQNPIVHFFAVRLLNSFPFNLIFHEGGIIYTLICFFKAVRLIKKEKITHLYSSFRPYSDHFTAYLLKIFFPKLIWIADFRDLHIEPQYRHIVFEPFQHWCNKQILKKANIVTTVSEGLAKHLKRYKSNVYVLRNGVTFENLNFVKNPLPKFTVAYTGSMFGDERNPTLFLEVIKSLKNDEILSDSEIPTQSGLRGSNFQILYAGKDTGVWQTWINRFELNDFFKSEGMVSAEEAMNIQRNSHLNLMLTSATSESTGQITGKFYEYLAAKNPIIVLIDGVQDVEIESLTHSLNAGCVVYNNRSFDELRSFILEKFREWETKGDVTSTLNIEKLKALSWENQVQKFVEHLNL
jgi:glycosyltransferase involved in cell wall biosynthesis